MGRGKSAVRTASLILAAGCLASSGCSMLVKHSGTDISTLATRDQVHEVLGEPTRVSELNGDPVEEFETHRKIADAGGFHGLGEEYSLTLGLVEFVRFPQELYTAISHSVSGQQIQFTYNADGYVTYIRQDGEPVTRNPYRR